MNGISYVVTIYNKADFIPAMIEGLKRQTGDFAREFIFVDDGSSDNSLEILESLTHDWPDRKIICQDNAGPSVATNVGAAGARYKWLKFVDGDDVIAPWTSEKMIQACESYDLDALYSIPDVDKRQFHLYPDGILDLPSPGQMDIEPLAEPMALAMRSGLYGMTNIIVRREAFEAVGGCDTGVFVQEFSLPLRLARKHKIGLTRTFLNVAPKEAEGRVSGIPVQILYDITLSQKNFLEQNRDIPFRQKHFLARRAIGRGWKWMRRQNGKSLFSSRFALYVWAQLRLPVPASLAMRMALEAFDDVPGIRRVSG